MKKMISTHMKRGFEDRESSDTNLHGTPSVLDRRLGSKMQWGIIMDVRQVIAEDKRHVASPKIVLTVEIANTKRLRVDESWTRDRRGDLKAHGLWVKLDFRGDIMRLSPLGSLMLEYNVTSLRDFVGRKILLYPKSNQYMVAVGTSNFDKDEAEAESSRG